MNAVALFYHFNLSIIYINRYLIRKRNAVIMFDKYKTLENEEGPHLDEPPTASKSDSILSRKATTNSFAYNSGKKNYDEYNRKFENFIQYHRSKEAEFSTSLHDQTTGGLPHKKPSKPKIVEAMKRKSAAVTASKSVRTFKLLI